ncbi:MAG TPA: nuclear transport factor 2 family protein, partial [Woeseiaceae bacterium]|nr:nuclear transport factor 2 family protein [Woeseiaceae bacterium]
MQRAATMAALMTALAAMLLSPVAGASVADDEKAVAALDKEYQAAVKRNDVATMDRIMHDDFLLVPGNGTSHTRNDLLEEAAAGTLSYEQQDEIDGTQTVRVSGDTALVTALLWIKGESEGQPFDRKLWFSDTYVRSGSGWQYLYGQASLPLPPESANDNEARVVEIRSYNLK